MDPCTQSNVNMYENEEEKAHLAKLRDYSSKVQLITKSLKELVNEGKSLEKSFSSVVKKIKQNKVARKKTERPLSGFALPTKLSDELYDFLNIEKGTSIARKDVTKLMNAYIVENGCRDVTDRRKIIPNDALKQLFQCADSEEITYFNLQKFMKKHYIKT